VVKPSGRACLSPCLETTKPIGATREVLTGGLSFLIVETLLSVLYLHAAGNCLLLETQAGTGAAGAATVTISGLAVVNSDDTGIGVYVFCTLTLAN
jgi:hypothetical protein